MDGKVLARILSALVLVAAIADIAFLAYNAGIANGTPVTIQAPSGTTDPVPYPYYGYPFHRPFGFGLGFLGLLLGLFLFFHALRAFRFLLWGPRWGGGQPVHGGGPWGMHFQEGVPPMFDEWHQRAHEAKPEEKE